MDRNCTACNVKIDKDNYKKDRTVCKSCYNEKKKNCIKISENKQFNDNRTLFVGPFLQVKLMLKILSRIPDRDFYIITNSPPEQYSNCKSKMKEIGEKIKPLNEY